MIGILYDENYSDHNLFKNFGQALKNYFSDYKHVKSIDDLTGIKTLIIVDEHLATNVEIWKNDNFINSINKNKIKTIIFNFEKIYDSQFPWNEAHQQQVERIENLHQFFSDIDDSKRNNQSIINKQFLSKDVSIKRSTGKKNKILFIGQISGPQYSNRANVLRTFRQHLPVEELDIVDSKREYTYDEYLDILSQYKYILNPLGTGKFLNLRFYEALELGCIPVQQVTDDMIKYYDELKYSIAFRDFNDLASKKIHHIQKYNSYYLEDYFEDINLRKYIID